MLVFDSIISMIHSMVTHITTKEADGIIYGVVPKKYFKHVLDELCLCGIPMKEVYINDSDCDYLAVIVSRDYFKICPIADKDGFRKFDEDAVWFIHEDVPSKFQLLQEPSVVYVYTIDPFAKFIDCFENSLKLFSKLF